MSKLILNFADEAKQEGRAVVRVIHVADAKGMHLEDHHVKEFRLGGDGLTVDVEPGCYSIQAYWRTGSASYTSELVDGGKPSSVALSPYKSSWPEKQDESSDQSRGVLARQMSLPRSDDWSFLLGGGPAIGESSFLVGQEGNGDVPITLRNRVGYREWIAYRHNGRPVLASLPLCPTPFGSDDKVVLRPSQGSLPRLAFSEDQADIAVMCDMLCGNSSHTETLYLATFPKSVIDELLETDPLHYVAFALANTHSVRSELATFPTSRHEDWLPDLLILRAYHHLFTGRDDLARQFLNQSVKIGVPYFSRSVKILSECCSFLKHMHPELGEISWLAWNLAIRSEPREVFTTIRLDIPLASKKAR